ncbi:MAG: aminoacyl-tRNA hydrolase [Myxococcota bacterium]
MSSTPYKQVLVVRKDLGMRKGKMIAQGAHACLAAVLGASAVARNPDGGLVLAVPPEVAVWLDGLSAKIAVGVPSEEALLDVHARALAAGLPAALIRDAGRTEFHGVPTLTACAVGPGPSAAVDAVTGELTLL